MDNLGHDVCTNVEMISGEKRLSFAGDSSERRINNGGLSDGNDEVML
jgi:hypothetical protein